MAFLITSGSNEAFYRHVRQYYRIFRREPRAPGLPEAHIQAVVPLPDWNLEALLAKTYNVSNQLHDKDVVIVSHAKFDDQGNVLGLKLPLNSRTAKLPPNSSARVNTVGLVLNLLEGLLNNPQTATDAALNQMDSATLADPKGRPIRLPPATFARLFFYFQRLRYLRLNRVEIRACQLGSDPNLLALFGRCLGCNFISAPDSDVYWGEIDVPAARLFLATPNIGQWVSSPRRPGARAFRNTPLAGSPIREFGMWVVPRPPPSHQADFHYAANTRELGWFADQFFMPGSVLFRPAPAGPFVIPMHAVRDQANSFFLPRETGYSQHIVQVGPLPGAMIVDADAPESPEIVEAILEQWLQKVSSRLHDVKLP
jgi:hypothetical protein